MTAPKVETLVWVLVYLGLILLSLGLSVRRRDPGLGWGIASVGIASTVAGIVLIYVRSRMKSEHDLAALPSSKPTTKRDMT